MRSTPDTGAAPQRTGAGYDLDPRFIRRNGDEDVRTEGGAPVQGCEQNTRAAVRPLSDGEAAEIGRRAGVVTRNIASVILGKEDVIESCVVALLAGGHVIVEDYPGVGKTLLAKALARSVGGRFSRIQFTPDLLPSDVTGVSVFDQQSTRFEFRAGPVFANVVLADEINRASPKTQASLLECMEEGQATVDNVAHRISSPFMIVATQNPIEYEGTYPLPEAQLDRFMLRVSLGYPSPDAEEAILESQTSGDPYALLEPVLQAADVLAMQKAVLRVSVTSELRRYVVDLVAATRGHREIYLGASPRAGIALLRAAKAHAVLSGRNYVVPRDVKDLAARVLGHRVILSTEADAHARAAEEVIGRILQTIPVPGPGR
jgi:MoxR-like ATPase